jgi:hypothetical protein
MQNPEQTDRRDPGAVNHPGTEEWISYLYGETPRASKASLTAHLKTCVTCRNTLAPWQAAQACLAQWQLGAPCAHRRFAWALPALKWALAALVVLGLGYAIGRVSGMRTDALEPALRASLVDAVKQQVRDEIRADWQAVLANSPDAVNTDFRRQLRSDLDQWSARTVAASRAESQHLLLGFADTYSANRQQDHQTFLTLFDRANQKRQAEYVSLRRALETVAVVADDKFQRTDSELGQLASYAEARFVSDKTSEPFEPATQSNRKGN